MCVLCEADLSQRRESEACVQARVCCVNVCKHVTHLRLCSFLRQFTGRANGITHFHTHTHTAHLRSRCSLRRVTSSLWYSAAWDLLLSRERFFRAVLRLLRCSTCKRVSE